MKAVEIEVICTATLKEQWTYLVPDEWTAQQTAEAFDDHDVRLDAFVENHRDAMQYVSVTNVAVYDEHDREVMEVRDAPLG